MKRTKWIVEVRNKLSSLAMECDSCAAIEATGMTRSERQTLQKMLSKASLTSSLPFRLKLQYLQTAISFRRLLKTVNVSRILPLKNFMQMVPIKVQTIESLRRITMPCSLRQVRCKVDANGN